ncbi:MAG: cobalt transporter [Acidobacteria bacterium]|nr:cobalt transporter [Acidobacteriota bacterium]
MHIPDGFLATPVWLGLNAAGLPLVGYLARQAQRHSQESRVPLLGVMGAFVFAAQMINFPVGVGASGHLVGSALLAITLGPAAAAVVMTAILAIQALIFQDGGVLALGANVLNMALAGVLAGYLPYHWWGEGRFRRAAIFLGGFASVLVGAVLAIAELRLSGVPIPAAVLWVSLALFTVTAALEGAITVAVVGGLERLGIGLARQPVEARPRGLAVVGLAAVLLAAVGVLFASTYPDGLEKMAQALGLEEHARALYSTPLADYSLRWLGSSWTAQAVAGLLGLTVIFGLLILLGRMFARRGSR